MTVPDAVAAAKRHLAEVLPEFGSPDAELEELEARPGSPTWRFTFSVFLPPVEENSLAALLRGRRLTKSVDVDS
jgi:hypothetical protein